MHVGLLGTMAQLYLSDLKDKTRRGLLGRVLQARAAGGRAYGFRVVGDDVGGPGARRIVPGSARSVPIGLGLDPDQPACAPLRIGLLLDRPGHGLPP
jgi:hypothetical protein